MKWKIIHIDETDSTNRWLREHGNDTSEPSSHGDGHQENRSHLTGEQTPCEVVVAEYQTAGRGCGTNSWESERGKNLLFSMLIHPTELPATEQFFISQAVSVALYETLSNYLNHVSIKWPNDIYVGKRKICGILIENRLHGTVIKDSIIGIGLNVNQLEFLSDAPNPVSLRQLTGKEWGREALLLDFLDAFDRAFSSKTTCFTYEKSMFLRGKHGVFRDKTTCFTATLLGVSEDGRLLLRDEAGRERSYAFKEVEFVLR